MKGSAEFLAGFMQELKDLEVPSRHLGLTMPEEMEGFGVWLGRVAEEMEKNVDIDMLLAIGEGAPEIGGDGPDIPVLPQKVRIGVARDEAFSFYYTENLELLCRMGAELVEFSPLHDRELPPQLDGLLLGGGYPENYAGELEQAAEIREAVRKLCGKGIPCLAECGGCLPHVGSSSGQGISHRQTVPVWVYSGGNLLTGAFGGFRTAFERA